MILLCKYKMKLKSNFLVIYNFLLKLMIIISTLYKLLLIKLINNNKYNKKLLIYTMIFNIKSK